MHDYLPIPTAPPPADSDDGRLPTSTPGTAVGTSDVWGDGGTKRSLKERHLSMIALAGMIGTGLFLSSGKALAQGGPLGCVLGFLMMGTVTAAIALISAEMSALKPAGGGFVRHASMWVDRSCGIVLGWNFWYSMAVTMPAEITAATTLLGFWNPKQNPVIPIMILWLAITFLNLGPVKYYGEFEFSLAFIKIAFIVVFIVSGLVLDMGSTSAEEPSVGFRYWSQPYPLVKEYLFQGFTGKIAGFWSTMIAAAFAYGNVQIVAIAGAETQNPRQSIPAALKTTFLRVVVFYVLSIFVISLLIPADDPRLSMSDGTAAQSPFVIAFSRAGYKAIPSICNAVIFLSASSSANACTFLASRTLHGLALDGNAPSIFLKLNRYHVPYLAVLASSAWGAVAFLTVADGAYGAFLWLISIVTTAGLVSWTVICISYLRLFHSLRKLGIPRNELPYQSPFQPYLTWYALVVNVLVVLTSGWTSFTGEVFNGTAFWSTYMNCILVPSAYVICKWYIGDSLVPLESFDIKAELTAIEREKTLRHRRTSTSTSA